MAETFRKAKIEHYLERLRNRKLLLKSQIGQPEFDELRSYFQGQITVLEEVISELEEEFGMKEASI